MKMQFSILEMKVNLPIYFTNPTLIFPRLLHVIGVPWKQLPLLWSKGKNHPNFMGVGPLSLLL